MSDNIYSRLIFDVSSIKSLIQEEYGLLVKRVNLLDQYSTALVYRVVDDSDAEYHLRILSDITIPMIEHFEIEINFFNFLQNKTNSCVQVRPTIAGELTQRYDVNGIEFVYALFPILPTELGKVEQIDTVRARQIGIGLAHFHQVSSDFDLKGSLEDGRLKLERDLEIVQQTYQDDGIIVKFCNLVKKQISEVYTSSPNSQEYGIVHGNFSSRNLVFDNNLVYTDNLHFLHFNWRALDICIAEIQMKLFSQDEPDKLVQALYEGYQSVRKLTEGEKQNPDKFLNLGKISLLGDLTRLGKELCSRAVDWLTNKIVNSIKMNV